MSLTISTEQECFWAISLKSNLVVANSEIISLATASEITHCDYGFYGVTIILLFYIFKNSKIKLVFSFIFTTAVKYIIPILKYSFSIEYIYLFLVRGHFGHARPDK